MLLMVDYGGMGVLTVLIFYFLRERKWWCKLLQLVLLLIINVTFLGALGYGVTANVFGRWVEIPQQGFAVLALIPIWLYHGRQGYHSKPFQYICYAFYPVHMLILYIISAFIL
jgi:cell division protein FtsW (lipid II flippase)